MPNRAMRLLPVLALLLALGCGGDPLAGELLLQGPEPSGYGGPVRLRLFLPEGAGAGRPFWIDDAQTRLEGRPLFQETGTFDDEGRASLTCNLFATACSAVLDGTTGCVTIVAERGQYLPSGGDQAWLIDGTLEVCPIDGEPAHRTASLTPPIDATASAPIRALALRAWVPLDVDTLGSLEVTHDGAIVPSHYEGTAFAGRLVLDAPVDPSGTIAIDATDVLDVMGGLVTTTATVPTTTAVLEDLSLDTAPTEGAIAVYGAAVGVTGGVLVATDTGAYPRVRPFLALIALGDPGAATAVRIEGHQAQRSGGLVTARVVRAGGVAGEPTSPPTTTSGTVDAPIPAGSGPIWLVLHSAQDVAVPVDLAAPGFLTVESIALVAP